MPSGELLAPSLFTEHGVQSVRSTNESDKSENVVSKFLSQPARNYISGSELSTIETVVDVSTPASGTDPVVAEFRLPGNCDVISSVSLTILNNRTAGYSTKQTDVMGGAVACLMVDKIEVRIGNSLFQTLSGSDILARQLTEYPLSGAFNLAHTTGPNINTYNLNTGIFSGSGGYINSFLQCGAPNQNMNIKVFFVTNATIIPQASSPSITARLEFMKHSLTSTEREYVTNNIINSVIHSSESIGPFSATSAAPLSLSPASRQIIPSGYLGITSNNLGKYIFNLNEFRLNCSHIIVATPFAQEMAATTETPRINLIEAQLKIGGSYHGGPYSAAFMKNQAKTILGLNASNTSADTGIYVIPLGSYKFGSDSIPLSKVHNIQLELTIDYLAASNSAGIIDSNLFITAVGTNVLTYSGGSVNIHF